MKAEEEGLVLEFPLEHYRFETAGEASSKIKQVVRQLGVNAQTARRISVCAYEAELNAIIHAYGGFMRVRVFPDRTELEVTDEGPGIPAVHQDRVFERFYRVDPSRSKESGGTGLGLAIVKHIVQIHRGSVSVKNNPDRGCTFTIYLPKCR